MAELFLQGFIAHLVADFFLQTEEQALNKSNLRHPAGYLHLILHLLCYSFVFPFWPAALLAATHWLIDLRTPLIWWRKNIGQTTEGPAYLPFAMLQDQALHIIVLYIFCRALA